MALATDFNPGTAPAYDLQLSMMLAAAQMKMSAAEILCGVTFNAAAALGLETTHGVLSPGRVGDVLLFDARSPVGNDGQDVLQSIILSRRRPMEIIARGERVSR